MHLSVWWHNFHVSACTGCILPLAGRSAFSSLMAELFTDVIKKLLLKLASEVQVMLMNLAEILLTLAS